MPEASLQCCPQCGAVVEGAALSAACAFCASPLEASAPQGTLAPERLVPFRLSRQQAAERLQRWLHRHWLLPRELRQSIRADALHAVMVPFYAYTGAMETRARADVGLRYTVGSGDDRQTRTEWFSDFAHRHVLEWRDHLVSASRGVPEALANRLEPFDLEQALPYAPALIAGMEAEHPSISTAEADEIVREELLALRKRRIHSDAFPGMRTRDLELDSDLQLQAAEAVLLPVWIASCRGPRGTVTLLVNGQTGAAAGELPRDLWRPLRALLLAMLVLTVVVAGGVLSVALLPFALGLLIDLAGGMP